MNERYYPASIKYINAGESGYIVKNRNTGESSYLNKGETELLLNLEGSKTLENHFEDIISFEKYNISASVFSEKFREWTGNGFLRNEKILTEYFREKNNNIRTGNSSIPLVSGVITSSRPALLKNCLSSRIESAEYNKINPHIIVCDDTVNTNIKDQNKKIIENFIKNYKGEISYIDVKGKRDLSQKIKQSFPDTKSINKEFPSEEIIDFALSISSPEAVIKRTAGSNRNSLFLSTAGCNLYSSDDDIEYKVLSGSLDKSIYSFSNESEVPVDFFPELIDIENKIKDKQYSELFTYFNSFTGRDPRLVQKSENLIIFENITPETALLMEKGQLKINTVTTGIFGARWFNRPYYPLFQINNRLNDYLIDYEKYKKIISNGLNILEFKDFTLSQDDFLIGANYCIDNTELTSPCFPLGNREDIVAEKIKNAALNPGLKLKLPQIIKHSTINKKPFSKNNFTDTSLGTGTYSTIIIDWLSQSLINPRGASRMKELGYRIQEFCRLENSDFIDQIKLMQLSVLTDSISRINYLLEIYTDSPEWIIKDLESWSSLLKKEAEGKETLLPFEFRTNSDFNINMDIFKSYLNKCGEMLYWWPEIWEAARQINMEGRGISI